jgi:hypothetical protein
MSGRRAVGGWVLTAAVIGAACVAVAAEKGDPANLMGVKNCKMCHSKEDTGNQYAKWKETKHAKAFETLGTPAAREAGAKLGVEDPQKSGKCLKCHATAYYYTETSQTDKLTPEDGVTCESCHGPGKNYKAKETMESREKSIAGGLIHPATKSCVNCHNPESPTHKGDFNAEEMAKKIEHPNPKAKTQ